MDGTDTIEVREGVQVEKPACTYGFSFEQLERIIVNMDDFRTWMDGQTQMLCEGKSFNHETRMHEPSACAETPHGPVCFTGDVLKYLSNRQF